MSVRLKYPLQASTLSRNSCSTIMFPALRAALPRSGVCATIATDIRQGPKSSGGLGVLSLFDYQGTSRTSALVEHRFRQTSLGTMMNTLIEDIVQEIGLYGPLWNMNLTFISKYISHHSWIYHVIQYNFDNKIDLNITHTELGPRRCNDHSIMSLAAKTDLSTADLRSINKVRIFLNVIQLSDITSADGRTHNDFYSITNSSPRPRNTYSWPKKHHITAVDFTRWRKFIRSIYSLHSCYLYSPLGNWVDSKSICLQ